MLGEAHRPASNGCRGSSKPFTRMFDLLPTKSRIRLDNRPGCGLSPGDHVLEPLGFFFNELNIDGIVSELCFDEAFHQGGIPANPHVEVQISKRGCFETCLHVILRVLEPSEAGFGERVDVDDFGTGLLGVPESRQHARMIGAGVLADDHDHIGGRKIVERDRAFSDTDGLDEGFTA